MISYSTTDTMSPWKDLSQTAIAAQLLPTIVILQSPYLRSIYSSIMLNTWFDDNVCGVRYYKMYIESTKFVSWQLEVLIAS